MEHSVSATYCCTTGHPWFNGLRSECGLLLRSPQVSRGLVPEPDSSSPGVPPGAAWQLPSRSLLVVDWGAWFLSLLVWVYSSARWSWVFKRMRLFRKWNLKNLGRLPLDQTQIHSNGQIHSWETSLSGLNSSCMRKWPCRGLWDKIHKFLRNPFI